ncbi:hypothetical protein BDC45DRAFT_538246 [Circinella umbellata]|nr:hypothetical protein BDC45DRAFT_538246 [Circinella umbellata]
MLVLCSCACMVLQRAISVDIVLSINQISIFKTQFSVWSNQKLWDIILLIQPFKENCRLARPPVKKWCGRLSSSNKTGQIRDSGPKAQILQYEIVDRILSDQPNQLENTVLNYFAVYVAVVPKCSFSRIRTAALLDLEVNDVASWKFPIDIQSIIQVSPASILSTKCCIE